MKWLGRSDDPEWFMVHTEYPGPNGTENLSRLTNKRSDFRRTWTAGSSGERETIRYMSCWTARNEFKYALKLPVPIVWTYTDTLKIELS